MKLGKVTKNDPLIRVALSLHSSASETLKHYQRYYKATTGDDISMSQLVEEVTKRFMRDDRGFQKFCDEVVGAQAARRPASNS